MNQGWSWLITTKDEWLKLVTEEEYGVLERFGFDRGTDVSPSEGAGVATLEAQMISLQKTQDEQRTEETAPLEENSMYVDPARIYIPLEFI